MSAADPLLTPEDLSVRWTMPKRTILNWCYQGKLSFAMHLPGGQWRFHKADVEKFEKERRVGKAKKETTLQ